MGVVTREIACANFIHICSTGSSFPGMNNPEKTMMSAIAAARTENVSRPRQKPTAAMTPNAAARVSANLLPCDAVNGDSVMSVERNQRLPRRIIERRLFALVQQKRSDDEIIEMSPHETAIGIFRSADDRLSANIE